MQRAISQLLIITENLKVFEIPILLGKKAQHPIIAGTQRIPNHDYYCDTIKLLKVTRTHRSSQFSLQRITAPNIFFNASQLPIFASTHHSSQFSLQRITSPNCYGPKSQLIRTKVPVPNCKISTFDIASTTHSNANFFTVTYQFYWIDLTAPVDLTVMFLFQKAGTLD